jgi:hypothetical protein
MLSSVYRLKPIIAEAWFDYAVQQVEALCNASLRNNSHPQEFTGRLHPWYPLCEELWGIREDHYAALQFRPHRTVSTLDHVCSQVDIHMYVWDAEPQHCFAEIDGMPKPVQPCLRQVFRYEPVLQFDIVPVATDRVRVDVKLLHTREFAGVAPRYNLPWITSSVERWQIETVNALCDALGVAHLLPPVADHTDAPSPEPTPVVARIGKRGRKPAVASEEEERKIVKEWLACQEYRTQAKFCDERGFSRDELRKLIRKWECSILSELQVNKE